MMIAIWSVFLSCSSLFCCPEVFQAMFCLFWSIHQTKGLIHSGVWRGWFVLFACCIFQDGDFVIRWECGSFKFDSAAMCGAVEMNMVTLQKNETFESFTLSGTAFVSLRLLIITGFDSCNTIRLKSQPRCAWSRTDLRRAVCVWRNLYVSRSRMFEYILRRSMHQINWDIVGHASAIATSLGSVALNH